MIAFFCFLYNTQKSISKYKIAITRYAIIFISIALVACNISSKQEPAKNQIELPNPGSLNKVEVERLRIACEYSLQKKEILFLKHTMETATSTDSIH